MSTDVADHATLMLAFDEDLCDEIVLETLDPMKPATVRSTEGGDYLYLLMPVRLTN